MRKRLTKTKLKLNQETLRALTDPEKLAVGGAGSETPQCDTRDCSFGGCTGACTGTYSCCHCPSQDLTGCYRF
jgi:hypothetical protein